MYFIENVLSYHFFTLENNTKNLKLTAKLITLLLFTLNINSHVSQLLILLGKLLLYILRDKMRESL